MRNIFILFFVLIFLLTGCDPSVPGKNGTEDNNKDIKTKVASIDLSKKEAAEAPVLKNSRDDTNYVSGGKIKIRLIGGREETLYISSEEMALPDNTSANKPIRVKLRIVDNETVYESTWNDGVYVSTADFDINDNDLNIYITKTGTDVGATTNIYKYDGTELAYCDSFKHFGRDFCYDQTGMIYFWYNSKTKDFNNFYNYKTRQTGEITDENIKAQLEALK